MTIGQGTRKITVVKKQAGLGVPASGTGGQILRRRTSTFTANRDMYESDEMVSHHQSTGSSYGLKHGAGRVDGLLSCGTYKIFMEALLEAAFAAVPAIEGAELTIAGTGPTYTVTRSAGDFLADGVKVGDVVALSVGTLHANNINKNLWVVGVTALVLTVIVLNGSEMEAEGPISGCTVTVRGKKCKVPLTGHTDDYLTIEEWYADLSRSELFTDMRVSQMAFGLPATGNATVSTDLVGLERTPSGAQVLTTPTAETTTEVMASINGAILVNGVVQGVATGLQFTVANGAADMGGVIGSNVSPDVSRGRVRVTGQFTALFDSATLTSLYDAETPIALQVCVATGKAALADFQSFVIPKIKLTGDAPDDGEKGIVRTYPFVAELNGEGGPALANDKTILSIQDSQA